MRIARLRALTPFPHSNSRLQLTVEMRIARLRALTPSIISLTVAHTFCRNEYRPIKGIDTTWVDWLLVLMLFFRRNEYRPIKGIDTCLSYTHNRNCKYRRNEYRPIKGIDTLLRAQMP